MSRLAFTVAIIRRIAFTAALQTSNLLFHPVTVGAYRVKCPFGVRHNNILGPEHLHSSESYSM